MVLYAAALIVAVLLLAADVMFSVRVLSKMAGDLALARHGTEAAGHVVAIEPRPRTPPRVRIAFQTADGRRVEHTAGMLRAKIGQSQQVRYDPDDPARATTQTRARRRMAVVAAGALFVAAAAVAVISGCVYYFSGGRDSAILNLLVFFPLLLLLGGALALAAEGEYRKLSRWRRMVTTEGKVVGFDDENPDRPSLLISFTTAGGRPAKFFARAGMGIAPAGVGDAVTVYYDPEYPEQTATVQAKGFSLAVAVAATAGAVGALVLAVGGVWPR